MLYKALPADGLVGINTIKNIPDIEDYQGFYEAVYALYRSGILGGVNNRGFFRPYEALLRCDYETLASRVADPEERIRQTLAEAILDKAGTIQLEKNTQKTFDAAFISAPESYLATLEEMPSYTLPLGDWIGPTDTRATTYSAKQHLQNGFQSRNRVSEQSADRLIHRQHADSDRKSKRLALDRRQGCDKRPCKRHELHQCPRLSVG